MSGEKRRLIWAEMLIENKQTIFVLCVLFAIALMFAPVFKVTHSHGPYDYEFHDIKMLLTAFASFAADNENGEFPAKLVELYPDYVDDQHYLKSNYKRDGENMPYTYFPNLTNTSDSGTLLIASPVIKSKKSDFRIVGYVGGHVVKVREADYRKMISK